MSTMGVNDVDAVKGIISALFGLIDAHLLSSPFPLPLSPPSCSRKRRRSSDMQVEQQQEQQRQE